MLIHAISRIPHHVTIIVQTYANKRQLTRVQTDVLTIATSGAVQPAKLVSQVKLYIGNVRVAQVGAQRVCIERQRAHRRVGIWVPDAGQVAPDHLVSRVDSDRLGEALAHEAAGMAHHVCSVGRISFHRVGPWSGSLFPVAG